MRTGASWTRKRESLFGESFRVSDRCGFRSRYAVAEGMEDSDGDRSTRSSGSGAVGIQERDGACRVAGRSGGAPQVRRKARRQDVVGRGQTGLRAVRRRRRRHLEGRISRRGGEDAAGDPRPRGRDCGDGDSDTPGRLRLLQRAGAADRRQARRPFAARVPASRDHRRRLRERGDTDGSTPEPRVSGVSGPTRRAGVVDRPSVRVRAADGARRHRLQVRPRPAGFPAATASRSLARSDSQRAACAPPGAERTRDSM